MPSSVRPLALATALVGLATAVHAQPLDCQGAPSAARLIVAVEGVRSSEGFVVGELYGPDRQRFLKDHEELLNWKAPAQAGTTVLCLNLPAPGPYEVVVYHDANANGRIDKDFIGRPTEAYGFSNNVKPVFHKPSLESARFEAAPGDTRLHIRLIYPKPPDSEASALLAGETILVTGASGFVGAAVLRAAVAKGARARVLVRPSSPRRNLDGVDCQVVVGDMTDPASMAEALRGARYLFHVAADYRLWSRDASEMKRANLGGTEVVMEAALAAGVERIVYTSSVATFRAADAATIVDETAPLDEREAIGAYKQSKVAAERLVERMTAERALPAVIVNPSTPIGPRDVKPTPTGRILVEAATGRMPAFVDTGLNLVHVDDVADGHLAALAKGQVGQRYILGGQNVSLRDLLAEVAALTGRKAPTVGLPRLPLYPLAWAAEAVAWVTGKAPFVSRDALRMASHHMFFSSAKAERDLGYRARPHGEALADALAWFGAAGYLK